MVTRDGFTIRPGGEPDEADVRAIREQLPTAPADVASVLGNRELFGRLALDALLPAMRSAVEDLAPDLVLREPTEYASAVVASQRSLPVAQIAISLANAEWGSIDAAAPAVERHDPLLTAALRSTPYFSRFPAALDPSPFPATFRYHVPVPRVAPSLPSSWWPDTDGPLVYATLGTVTGHLANAPELFRVVVDALAAVPARVLLTIGRTLDASLLGDLPQNVHCESWIDQDLILPQADLVVCHGGSGTVYAAVDQGVPLVVIPSFADQFANGQLIERSGLGRCIESESVRNSTSRSMVTRSDTPRVSDAILQILDDPTFRTRVTEIADRTRSTPSTLDIVSDFERMAFPVS